MRVNLTVLRISTIFLADPKAPLWAYFLQKRLGMSIATLMKALAKMEDGGWLVSEEERVRDRSLSLRPPRRLYRITELGIAQTKAALADLTVSPSDAAKA